MPKPICPRHGKPLTLQETEIEYMGVIFPCVIGKCPDCSSIYINRMIFPSCQIIKIRDCEYIYSPELNRLYPPAEPRRAAPAKKPRAAGPKPAKKEKASRDRTGAQSSSPAHAKPIPPDPENRILEKIPVLGKKENRCSFCRRDLQRTVSVVCRLRLGDGTAVYRKLPLRVCDKCGTPYARQKQIEELKKVGISFEPVSPMQYVTARTMMAEISRPGTQEKSGPVPEAQKQGRPALPDGISESSEVYELDRIPVLKAPADLCPYCGQPFSSRAHVRYPSYHDGNRVILKYAVLWECKSCHTVFADPIQLSDLRRWNEGAVFHTLDPSSYSTAAALMTAAQENYPGRIRDENELPFQNFGNRVENLSEKGNIVQVYASKCHCRKCQNRYSCNTMVNRTAVVQTIHGSTVKLNVMFCRGCGQYFVSLAALQRYQSLYGSLLMECRTASDVDPDRFSWFHFAPDTVLSRCGYTVKSGVTQEYRQAILRFILESGRAQKYEIIEKINGFIQLRDRNPIYAEACRRWREDIQFVSDYRLDRQKSVKGLTFQRGR